MRIGMTLYAQGETQGQKTIIWRINKNGFYKETIFTGNVKNKPKGWKIGK
jgi:hypothetical protein